MGIQTGRKVVPTELGITLVRGYQFIDPELCLPQVRLSHTHIAYLYAQCAPEPHDMPINSLERGIWFDLRFALAWSMQSLLEDMQSRSQSHAGSMAASSVCFCGQVRAHVERQIGLIAEGKAEKEAVVLHTLDQFAQKFRHFVTKIARMDALFEASFSPLASSGNHMQSTAIF